MRFPINPYGLAVVDSKYDRQGSISCEDTVREKAGVGARKSSTVLRMRDEPRWRLVTSSR